MIRDRIIQRGEKFQNCHHPNNVVHASESLKTMSAWGVSGCSASVPAGSMKNALKM